MIIEGQLIRKLPPVQRDTQYGKKDLTNFVVLSGGKELKGTLWGRLDAKVGSAVRFSGTEKTYKGDVSYTVDKAGVEVTGESSVAAASEPNRSEKATPPVQVASNNREDFRSYAEENVTKNILSAKKIIADLELGKTADLIELADMVGRTQTASYLDAKKGY